MTDAAIFAIVAVSGIIAAVALLTKQAAHPESAPERTTMMSGTHGHQAQPLGH